MSSNEGQNTCREKQYKDRCTAIERVCFAARATVGVVDYRGMLLNQGLIRSLPLL
jgi:hypothetical protein